MGIYLGELGWRDIDRRQALYGSYNHQFFKCPFLHAILLLMFLHFYLLYHVFTSLFLSVGELWTAEIVLPNANISIIRDFVAC